MMVFMCVSLLSCSHQAEQKEVEQALIDLRCEKALTKPDDTAETIKNSSKQVGKNILAYSYIAGNYTTEVLWDASAGVVLFVALCAPVMALAAVTNSHNRTSNFSGSTGFTNPTSHDGLTCIPLSDGQRAAIFSPPLGRKSVRKTQTLRCPDTKPVLSAIEKLVKCYQAQSDKESLQKALQTLINLENSESFYGCLQPADQAGLRNIYLDLQQRIAAVSVE